MVENSPENSWGNGDYIDHPTRQLQIKYPACPTDPNKVSIRGPEERGCREKQKNGGN